MAQDELKDQMPLFGGLAPQKKNDPVREASSANTASAANTTQTPPKVLPQSKRTPPPAAKKVIPAQKKAAVSGLVPAGDVRLTANIREDLHLLLKITAAKRRTTIGELIEELVENHLA